MAIYRKDCTVRLPFLRLSMLSPEAMLARGNPDDLSTTLNYLAEEESAGVRARPPRERAHPLPIPPPRAGLTRAPAQLHIPQPLRLTNPLINLVRTLAYQRQMSAEPMRPKEVEVNAKIVSDLSATLKTLFRI